MNQLATAAFTLALGCFAVIPPFLLGRWTKSTRCTRCDLRIRNAADRARANGERLARSVTPDAVHAKVDATRLERERLLRDQGHPLLNRPPVVRPIRPATDR